MLSQQATLFYLFHRRSSFFFTFFTGGAPFFFTGGCDLFKRAWFNRACLILFIVPVVTYSNADTQKLSILNENKKRAGVYCWTNIQNGKRYVGSSVDLSRRFSSYFSIKWLTSAVNSVINKALLKYGYSGFKLEILEYCDPKDVIEREQYYIDLLKPEYNVLKVAGSLYGHKHTKETINKIKAAAQNRKGPFLGKTHSEDTKAKMRTVALNRSIEAKANIGRTLGFKVEVVDTKTGEKTIYDSMRATARPFKLNDVTVITSKKKIFTWTDIVSI